MKKGSGRGLSSLLRGTSGLLVIAIDSKLVVLAVEELYRYFGGVCNEFPSSSALPWHLVNCQSPNRNFASMFTFHLVFRLYSSLSSRFNIVLMPIIITVIAYTYVSFVFAKFYGLEFSFSSYEVHISSCTSLFTFETLCTICGGLDYFLARCLLVTFHFEENGTKIGLFLFEATCTTCERTSFGFLLLRFVRFIHLEKNRTLRQNLNTYF